jgi:predicted urease superfamily metal-dependent hydrolase
MGLFSRLFKRVKDTTAREYSQARKGMVIASTEVERAHQQLLTAMKRAEQHAEQVRAHAEQEANKAHAEAAQWAQEARAAMERVAYHQSLLSNNNSNS